MAWGLAKIRPIFKAGDRSSVENYRPISLLSIVSKIIEKCVQKTFYSYLCLFVIINLVFALDIPVKSPFYA